MSDTKWNSRIEALESLKFHARDIYDTLLRIYENQDIDNSTRDVASGLLNCVEANLELPHHIEDLKEKDRIYFLCFTVDQALNSLESWFEQFNPHSDYFQFLYNIYDLKTVSKENYWNIAEI